MSAERLAVGDLIRCSRCRGWHPAEDGEVPYQIRSIANADLTEADIPGEEATLDQWSGIPSFAASFNGYYYWGSQEKCFDVGRAADRRSVRDLTLTELRTSLFCLYRSLQYQVWPIADDLPRAQAILREIRGARATASS